MLLKNKGKIGMYLTTINTAERGPLENLVGLEYSKLDVTEYYFTLHYLDYRIRL